VIVREGSLEFLILLLLLLISCWCHATLLLLVKGMAHGDLRMVEIVTIYLRQRKEIGVHTCCSEGVDGESSFEG
jgi:hypothetical protein